MRLIYSVDLFNTQIPIKFNYVVTLQSFNGIQSVVTFYLSTVGLSCARSTVLIENGLKS
jgi:hypothetical protein